MFSPGCGLIAAVDPSISTLFVSPQSSFVNCQPVVGFSVTLYGSAGFGVTLIFPVVAPLPVRLKSEPGSVDVKPNFVSVSLLGSVALSTVTVAFLMLVKVHLTCSPSFRSTEYW